MEMEPMASTSRIKVYRIHYYGGTSREDIFYRHQEFLKSLYVLFLCITDSLILMIVCSMKICSSARYITVSWNFCRKRRWWKIYCPCRRYANSGLEELAGPSSHISYFCRGLFVFVRSLHWRSNGLEYEKGNICMFPLIDQLLLFFHNDSDTCWLFLSSFNWWWATDWYQCE